MKINLFKKKKKEETIDVADKEKQQSEFQFMLDTETERAETLENLSLDTVEMGKTIIIPTEEKDKEDISSDENLDDEDEYEYVTVHYGRNAFVLAVIFVFVGIIVSYLVLAPSMKQTIRELYQNNGYMITNGSNATAADIKEGKTAFIRGQLVTGTYVEIDTNQATATANDILAGYTAYVNGIKITGTIPTYQGTNLISPSNTDIKIPKGYYLPEDITIVGSGELLSENIRKGIKIFSVVGTYEPN